jgi:hypothetical protein
MRPSSFWAYFFIFFATACLDRFSYEIEKSISQGISVTGYISNKPGPYEIRIYSIFDIESKESRKTPVSVKRIEIADNLGNSESLKEVNEGIYQTSPSVTRGVVGGIYKLKIELFDGKKYESLPDTILPPGSLDSMYIQYQQQYNPLGIKEYSFDVLFNSSYEASKKNQFIWQFTGTFHADTHPEISDGGCHWLDEIGKCNYVPACSGYRNVGTNAKPILKELYPCTCCTCWYNVYNESPILSEFSNSGSLNAIKAQSMSLNQWTLFYKIRIEMSQMSLTRNSFRFWKAIKNQQESIGSLFQPITGKIPGNFIQISGDPLPIDGLFYATAISNKVQYVRQIDLPPNLFYQIPFEKPFAIGDCRDLFPHSTNLKPAFWED